MPQQTYEVTAPDGRTLELTGDHAPTEADLKAAFAKLPPLTQAANTQAPAPSRTASVLNALPTALGATGAMIGATGGPLTAIAGAGVGGMVGDALKQGIGKVTGTLAESPEPLHELAGNAAEQAGTAGLLTAGGQALLAVPRPMLSKGGQILATMMLGGKAKLALKVASALAEHAGPLTEGTTATIPVAEEAGQTIAQRLARIPIQGRLEQIASQGANEAAAQSLKAGAQTLADDVGIIRSTIARRMMTPAEAIKVAAAGDEAYAALLKKAYLESVDRLGLPKPFVPSSVVELMKSPSFQRLPKP